MTFLDARSRPGASLDRDHPSGAGISPKTPGFFSSNTPAAVFGPGGTAWRLLPRAEPERTPLMPKLPFLLTRLDDDIPHASEVSTRLQKHLMRLRGHEVIDADLDAFDDAMATVSDDDGERIRRRAHAYVKRARAASGTAHLKPDEQARLAEIKDGVRAVTVKTESRADEIGRASCRERVLRLV